MKKARILFYTYRKSGKVAYGLRKTKAASILDANPKIPDATRHLGFFVPICHSAILIAAKHQKRRANRL